MDSIRSNCRSCKMYQDEVSVPIGDLAIPNYLVRRLKRNGIATIGALLCLTQEDLKRFYWVGEGSVELIQNALTSRGIRRLPR